MPVGRVAKTIVGAGGRTKQARVGRMVTQRHSRPIPRGAVANRRRVYLLNATLL